MGGPGSTRWRDHCKRQTVEQSLSLDLASLRRDGVLAEPEAVRRLAWLAGDGRTLAAAAVGATLGNDHGHLAIGLLDPAETRLASLQVLEVTPTRPNYGGQRWWFRCGCGERARKVYLPPSGGEFACRGCHGLTYRSAQEHDARVDALRKDPVRCLEVLESAPFHWQLLALKALPRWLDPWPTGRHPGGQRLERHWLEPQSEVVG